MIILNSGAPLYALQPEVLLNILEQVPDIATLRSAVSSCQYLRSIFREFECTIVHNVLKNFLGSERIHDAVATENLRLTSDSYKSLGEYLDKTNGLDLPKWRLQEIHHVEQLHLSVQHFSENLIVEIRSDHNLRERGFTLQSEPTTAEMSRIERSLYQIEALFRSLDGKAEDDEEIESSVAHFLSNFSPWENEQLACVYEHLRRAISPAIEDVCFNDPDWIEFLAGAEQSPDEGLIQTFLSKGLISAHTAVKAESIERRKEVLGTPTRSTIQPTLESVIEEIVEKAGNYPMLHEFEEDDNLEFIRRPLWQENDPGPEDSWRWAHQEESPDGFFFSVKSSSLRRFAYVMWDMDRLSALGILSQPWEGDDPAEFYAAEKQRIEQQHHDMAERLRTMTQDRENDGRVAIRALRRNSS